MRVVIDGTVGAGKTTILKGRSQRDKHNRKFASIEELGFPVFGDLIIDVIRQMRMQGINDPSENWELFFYNATQHAIEYYEKANPNTINFYDRGILYLEIMAKRYKSHLPKEYYDFCKYNRYDMPIFIFCPILGIDMTRPHKEDNWQKIYTDYDRKLQHQQVMELYKFYNYEVIEVPLVSCDINESVDFRIKMIKEVLGL